MIFILNLVTQNIISKLLVRMPNPTLNGKKYFYYNYYVNARILMHQLFLVNLIHLY